MKRLILLVMLSQIVFCAEAKQKNVEEGVDVYSTHSNTYNGSEFRSESISAISYQLNAHSSGQKKKIIN